MLISISFYLKKNQSLVLAEEECGSGFTCVFDQRIVAYGCAPLSNLSATACCSIGQGCNQAGQECGKW